MKKLMCLAIVATLLVIGCSDSNSPTEVEEDNYNGYYEVTAVPSSNSCEDYTPSIWACLAEGAYVDVDGDEIKFGGIHGTFDVSTKTGACLLAPACEDLGDGLFRCQSHDINIVFTDQDHFVGTYTIVITVSILPPTFPHFEEKCEAEWDISGTKLDP